MEKAGGALIVIVSGIITLAIIAVIVGSNAQTSNVITAGGSALSSLITAAVAPVAGTQGNLFGSAATSALGSLAGGGGLA
jgi:PRD1 phage membrane DNA delivery